MKIETFLFINFLVGVVSDIILNDLSKVSENPIIKSLKPYFEKHSIIGAGFYAGLTVLITLLPFIFYGVPNNNVELVYALIPAFILGYIADIIIEKLELFGPSLNPYYKEAGAGFYGGFAVGFSVFISYILQKYLLPVL